MSISFVRRWNDRIASRGGARIDLSAAQFVDLSLQRGNARGAYAAMSLTYAIGRQVGHPVFVMASYPRAIRGSRKEAPTCLY